MVKPKGRKKIGRPFEGGRDPLVGVRLPKELIARIDTWAAKHADANRSEAIRALIEAGLKRG